MCILRSLGYASATERFLSSSRFVPFVFLLGEERSDCHHLMVVRWVPCAFNMHDLGFFRPRSLSSESGLSLLAVFFSFASLSKRGFHPVARGRLSYAQKGFSQLLFRGEMGFFLQLRSCQ